MVARKKRGHHFTIAVHHTAGGFVYIGLLIRFHEIPWPFISCTLSMVLFLVIGATESCPVVFSVSKCLLARCVGRWLIQHFLTLKKFIFPGFREVTFWQLKTPSKHGLSCNSRIQECQKIMLPNLGYFWRWREGPRAADYPPQIPGVNQQQPRCLLPKATHSCNLASFLPLYQRWSTVALQVFWDGWSRHPPWLAIGSRLWLMEMSLWQGCR